MQVHENEEYQAVSFAKEAKRALSFLRTRDRKNNKQQGNSKFYNRHHHIQNRKYVQNKNFNMTWDYIRSFLGTHLLQKS